MIYCTICKDYFKEEHEDLWDCIDVYEKKNNEVGKTMKNYIRNLQKKEKVKYGSAFSRCSKERNIFILNKFQSTLGKDKGKKYAKD